MEIEYARLITRPQFSHKPKAQPPEKRGWVLANMRSKIQEESVYDHLLGIYLRGVYQQGIGYRLFADKVRICIPDFICGDTSEVKIVDAKLDYADDYKMDLYICLVEHILKTEGDGRKVKGAFALYESPWPVRSNFEIIRIKKQGVFI